MSDKLPVESRRAQRDSLASLWGHRRIEQVRWPEDRKPADLAVGARSLAEVLKHDGLMKPRQAAEIVHSLALAMAEVHRAGIIHRDLKPENIVFTEKGDLDPKICDFGLTMLTAPEKGMTREFLGTPCYLAPEQARADNQVCTVATDIYAVGAILYELLSGRPPFEGSPEVILQRVLTQEPPPLSSYRSDLDTQLVSICRTAMAHRMTDRWPSMEAFADALGQVIHQLQADSPPTGDPMGDEDRRSEPSIEHTSPPLRFMRHTDAGLASYTAGLIAAAAFMAFSLGPGWVGFLLGFLPVSLLTSRAIASNA